LETALQRFISGETFGLDYGGHLLLRRLPFARLGPAVETYAEGDQCDREARNFHADAGEELVVVRGKSGEEPRGVLVGRIKDITGEGDIGEDRRHRDDHGGNIYHLRAIAGWRKHARR